MQTATHSPPIAFDAEEALSFAINCAKSAGLIIRAALVNAKLTDTKSNSADLVTEYDRQCEELILGQINEKYPGSTLIAEESYDGTGQYNISDNITWFVDPIDGVLFLVLNITTSVGTNNFVHGVPWTCVSIGCHINKKAAIGVVYNPIIEVACSSPILLLSLL